MLPRIYVVDAFTGEASQGNPAAVCLPSAPREASSMQALAAEMNLSETAFLIPQRDGYDLRWFTPKVEDELCGHATLASAHVLWEEGHLRPNEEARFHTRSGLLTANKKGDWIEMDFPSEAPSEVTAPPDLLRALRVQARYVGRNRLDYIVELNSEEEVRNLTPDIGLLAKVATRGVIATSQATSGGYDFVSRFFAPRDGIDEDPVTGSAHCCLGPFWGPRLKKKEMTGHQISRRGGVVKVRLAGERIFLAGQAVTVLRGELA